jgi:hypothetical protein
MLTLVIVYYWIVTFLVFFAWLGFFIKDYSVSKTNFLPWLILIVGAIFWLFTLPFAYLELLKKRPYIIVIKD